MVREEMNHEQAKVTRITSAKQGREGRGDEKKKRMWKGCVNGINQTRMK